LDGDKNPIILDLDGSLTGIANSNVVRNNPFFTSPNCYERPKWAAQVCKEKFGQLYITNEDPAGTNFNGLTMTADSSTSSSILFAITRDDYSYYDLEMMGTPPYSGQYAIGCGKILIFLHLRRLFNDYFSASKS
jgi:hypothetical protein